MGPLPGALTAACEGRYSFAFPNLCRDIGSPFSLPRYSTTNQLYAWVALQFLPKGHQSPDTANGPNHSRVELEPPLQTRYVTPTRTPCFWLRVCLRCNHPLPGEPDERLGTAEDCPGWSARSAWGSRKAVKEGGKAGPSLGAALSGSGHARVFLRPFHFGHSVESAPHTPCRVCDIPFQIHPLPHKNQHHAASTAHCVRFRLLPASHPCSAPLSTVSRRLLGYPPGAIETAHARSWDAGTPPDSLLQNTIRRSTPGGLPGFHAAPCVIFPFSPAARAHPHRIHANFGTQAVSNKGTPAP